MIGLVLLQQSLQQAQATIAPTTIALANMSKPPSKHSPSVDEVWQSKGLINLNPN
jgi:hypothetical protein